MEGIERAIRHAAEAGKLRAYVRKNGSELRGLERLADRHSGAAATALNEIEPQSVEAADAITHAVAAARRRHEGVEVLANLHAKAARDALTRMLARPALAGRSHGAR